MTADHAPAFIAVDWGTSNFRLWLLTADGDVRAEGRSDQGMAVTPRDRFSAVLDEHLAALGVPADIPVVMCGMVGSRQGWMEARYLPVPVELGRVADNAVRVAGAARDIRILPGLSKLDAALPDVMRSEETQLLGLGRLAPFDSDAKRIVCMPGTHSKWVQLKGETVTDFASFITGEMYAVMATHSVLRHSLSVEDVDPMSPSFKHAVKASLNSPADLLSRLFSIRAAGLLHGLPPGDARAALSGSLIGQEIAGVLARFDLPGQIDLVGGNMPGALYSQALSVAGIDCRVHDGDALVIAGLTAAAAAIWETEFSAHSGPNK